MTHTLVVGTSEPQDFRIDDAGVAIDGTGFTIGIEITAVAKTGAAVGSPAPTVAWLVQADGTVRVSGAEVLTAGMYRVRFTLTDGSSNVGYAPNGSTPDTWRVVDVA